MSNERDKQEAACGGPKATESDAAASNNVHTLPTRREFLTGLIATSGWAAVSGLPQPAAAQAAVSNLETIGEIRSEAGRLRAVITIRNEYRLLPQGSIDDRPARSAMLRYFEGKNAAGGVVWPPQAPPGTRDDPGRLRPGPTLRARVGDQVEITFLNHVDVSFFAGSGSFDNAETGTALSCDAAAEVTGPVYPAMAGDTFPNCFHGSSTANLHFHGTHVTPDGLGDNVLLQLRPNPSVTETSVRAAFGEIFNAGMSGKSLARWSDLPKSWRDRQLALLKEYDETAVWQGKHGTPDEPALPPEQRLLPQTLSLIRSGHWPQYQIGAYPYCFKLTEHTDRNGKPTGYAMGQCPGTHWYHAHKHGSTALNVFNGMAGVFVIEGDYDDALTKIYPDLKKSEKVLIVQQFSDLPNLERRSRAGQHRLFVNGELNPVITMRKGEIQLWRLVNATVKAVTTLQPFEQKQGKSPEVRQTAQDGVQFHYANYKDQPLIGSLQSPTARPDVFAPGNRMDILVKAPDVEDSWELRVFDSTNAITFPLVTLTVKGEGAPMEFPTESNYPACPRFLADIDPSHVRIWRKVEFGWEPGRQNPGPSSTTGASPQLTIDGKQFAEGKYDQTMILGDSEEWKLTNRTSTIAHPFHIHVNPFQVVEIYDPAAPEKHYKPERNFVWQDTIAIPPSILDAAGSVAKDQQGRERLGYVVIRHRFVDFTGSYVLHCHMLAHEDRGMMQLVRVIPRETVIKHH